MGLRSVEGEGERHLAWAGVAPQSETLEVESVSEQREELQHREVGSTLPPGDQGVGLVEWEWLVGWVWLAVVERVH